MQRMQQLIGFVFCLFVFSGCIKVGDSSDVTVESTPEKIERGRYLANHVSLCTDCHSERDWTYFSGPVIPGTEGKGGEAFDEAKGFPGNIYSKNITPAALGNWTDGELIRSITAGLSKEGTPLFPLMPYPAYKIMAEEDVHAIVAYLKTLKPLENEVPETTLNFPLNFIVRTMPHPATPQKRPDSSDTLALGKYMATIAACDECHTPKEKGEPIAGMEFAGGFKFVIPSGTAYSANITPDTETGIGKWTKKDFINQFKFYSNPDSQRIVVPQGEFNTVMPWTQYSGMTEEDLGAIYDYLRTLKPVSNEVINFSAKKPADNF